MQVPLIDLKAQYAQIKDEVKAVIAEVLESQMFVWGRQIKELEQQIADYSQTKFGLGVASGSDALYLALNALGVGQGDEVITSTYTFFATAGAISRLGACPVFVDIDPLTYNIDPELIAAACTPHTKAILPVHLYGQCANMEPILKIAQELELAIVEDAAQAIGAEYRGKRAGSMGDAGCFSFFPSKNLGGMGDGGMVVTNDEQLAEKVHMLREHGSADRYYHKLIGVNSRLDTIQAAVLLIKLDYLPGWEQMRRTNAQNYRELFDDADLLDDVQLPYEVEDGRHVYNQFIIRTNRRDDLRHFLKEAGIATAVYYPLPLHLQDCYQGLGYAPGDFPEAEQAAQETLAIPVYPELTPPMQEYVVERIGEFFKG
ncbi:MAG: DegT/DnrJ/EryC1/StrS family aminotransferase [Candidatus Schekmanbacteria bacterium]|nr:DegT/DnrJ/EryC1/StrS family aminotransferase [Candidatus Schekmanbacteria bacterium]